MWIMLSVSYAFPIQRAIKISGDGKISMFSPEHLYARSQDLEGAWHDAGQFYWGRQRLGAERCQSLVKDLPQ